VTGACLAATLAAAGGPWRALPSLPDPEGFAGSFAGVSGGALLVAGGANFPRGRPWEGGTKVWHDGVFILARPGGAWRVAGRLPRPLGYGVSASFGDALVCVGGSDARRHHAAAFRLTWRGGRLRRADLPPLPAPVANGCGALLGPHLYVAGGQATPTSREALPTAYRLDLSARAPRWEALPSLPGPGRIFPTAAALDGGFWVMGGAGLSAEGDGPPQRRWLQDAWRYAPGVGWRRVADLPRPAVGAPSPAPVDAGGILLLGGDAGRHVGFTPPEQHPGFERGMLRYVAGRDAWEAAGEVPAPRVTVPCARWEGLWVIPSGEARPGVRSPEVWALAAGN